MNKPDWKDAPPWAKWLATDEDGDWTWYEYKPVPCTQDGHRYWNLTRGRWKAATEINSNWKQSLERRPKP
ncbi:MAG: hypothetical protein ACYCOU_21820 [Sulfobacillus sp.]